MEKYNEIRIREQNIQHLHQSLSLKEQLLRVSSQMKARFLELSYACRKSRPVSHVWMLELETRQWVEYTIHEAAHYPPNQ